LIRDRGDMSSGAPSREEREDGPGHSHQCQAGHRWQHASPTAVICLIPVFDSAGDCMRTGPEECPVCCGRDDVLVRDVHTHYCSMCDGDWDHEGRCPDGLPLECPWCFPKEVSPAPGARTGPHFHYCPACGTSQRHNNRCSAPFDAMLPDCSGCVGQNKREHAPTPEHLGRRDHLVRTVVVTGSLAASVVLALSFVPTEWPVFLTAVPVSVRPSSSPESRRVSTEPAQARTEQPSVVTALSGEPTQPLRREGIRAKRAKEVSPPGRSSRQSRSPEATLSPATASPLTTQSSGLTGSPRAATPEPSSPSPSVPASESTGGSPLETTERVAAAPIEDPARQTVKVPVIVRSIPGAPPFGTAGGSNGLETFPEGRTPRPINRSIH
jgi:hypothetical protein